jgi:hypothetical protein
MNLPKLSVPKFFSILGLMACSGIAATAANNPDLAAISLGLPFAFNALNAALGGYIGKHTGSDVPLLPEKFAAIENDDLEKCSLDAILRALILTVRQIPDSPESAQLPYGQRDLLTEFVTRMERELQWRLERVDTDASLGLNPASGSETFWAVMADQTTDLSAPAPAPDADPVPLRNALTNYALGAFFTDRQRAETYFPILARMLRDGFTLDNEPAHWFDLYCHALIDNLKRGTPVYCQRAETVIRDKGVATLIFGQRKQAADLKKLTDWSTTLQTQVDQLLAFLTEMARPRPPQPGLRVLQEYDTNEQNNHYRRRWVDMVGRDDAMDELTAFLNRPEPFGWWAVTGPGGMGKSRLALETCLRHGFSQHGQVPDWTAGFVVDDTELKTAGMPPDRLWWW